MTEILTKNNSEVGFIPCPTWQRPIPSPEKKASCAFSSVPIILQVAVQSAA